MKPILPIVLFLQCCFALQCRCEFRFPSTISTVEIGGLNKAWSGREDSFVEAEVDRVKIGGSELCIVNAHFGSGVTYSKIAIYEKSGEIFQLKSFFQMQLHQLNYSEVAGEIRIFATHYTKGRPYDDPLAVWRP